MSPLELLQVDSHAPRGTIVGGVGSDTASGTATTSAALSHVFIPLLPGAPMALTLRMRTMFQRNWIGVNPVEFYLLPSELYQEGLAGVVEGEPDRRWIRLSGGPSNAAGRGTPAAPSTPSTPSTTTTAPSTNSAAPSTNSAAPSTTPSTFLATTGVTAITAAGTRAKQWWQWQRAQQHRHRLVQVTRMDLVLCRLGGELQDLRVEFLVPTEGPPPHADMFHLLVKMESAHASFYHVLRGVRFVWEPSLTTTTSELNTKVLSSIDLQDERSAWYCNGYMRHSGSQARSGGSLGRFR